jgi:hypothetical protein
MIHLPSSLLSKPLQQFANRRQQIVHHADIEASAKEVLPWNIADVWKLNQWHFTVIALFYKLLEIFTEPTDLFTKRYLITMKAMDENVRIGNDLIVLGQHFKPPFTSERLAAAQTALGGISKRYEEMGRLLAEMKET